jgi:hypothetical protein
MMVSALAALVSARAKISDKISEKLRIPVSLFFDLRRRRR